MNTLAIDPGTTHSAYTVTGYNHVPITFGKIPNHQLLAELPAMGFAVDRVAIEMVASYGMPVGADVFTTCVWAGRFIQRLDDAANHLPVHLIPRKDIKLHHCGSSRAKDSNVTQALVDRFAPGVPNHGKGRKTAPGWFYGFSADVWAAYALAVYLADVKAEAA